MRVAFVVNDLRLSGGVGVVVEHAHQLRQRHGIDADLVLASDVEESPWRYRRLAELPVHALKQARHRGYDVVVATWWETVGPALSIPARRHAYFVQSLEDRFYLPHQAQRLGAMLTYDVPLDVVTEARWIAGTLEDVAPERRCLLVRNGVDKRVFRGPDAPPVRGGEPLRILIEGDPEVWLKGVPAALAATRSMTEPRVVTTVSPTAERLPGVERALGPLAQRDLAEEYAWSDVVVKLSRVEGMFGPPLEAFHMGATCVVTAVTGHDEYVEHGENGLVVAWDDVRGAGRALDLLARDRALLHRLRWGALATARGWPSWTQQGAVMAAALREIARRPPVAQRGFDARLLAGLRGGIERHALVAAERDLLRWRMSPVLELERALERPALRWAAVPARRAWSAARRKARR